MSNYPVAMTGDQLSEAEERDLWERILSTPSEEAFREFVLERVPLQPDDRVLSVGCGPGFETRALAERIDEEGHVTGVDVNERVLAAAEERCADLPNVSHLHGDATDLPVADGSYDVAVAKQVLTAVPDVEAALSELYRVLRPGGRLAVTAGDSRSHVMNESTERMRRANEIYRAEMGERRLGTRLRSLLPAAGFAVEEVHTRGKHSTEITDQIERGIEVQRSLLESSEEFDDAEIEQWERDLRALAEAGEFLSASVAFLYVSRKPR